MSANKLTVGQKFNILGVTCAIVEITGTAPTRQIKLADKANLFEWNYSENDLKTHCEDKDTNISMLTCLVWFGFGVQDLLAFISLEDYNNNLDSTVKGVCFDTGEELNISAYNADFELTEA